MLELCFDMSTRGALRVAQRCGGSGRKDLGFVLSRTEDGGNVTSTTVIGFDDGKAPAGEEIHQIQRAQRRQAALEALAAVELPDPEGVYEKYPHELSGGMLQRAMIAAAIVIRPRLLLLDEPTTALDVTIQAQILALLKKLNQESGISMLFISHNLAVVRKLCSRVAVMQRGVLVEEGETDQVFYHPQDPYTQRLIAAIPTRRRKEERHE